MSNLCLLALGVVGQCPERTSHNLTIICSLNDDAPEHRQGKFDEFVLGQGLSRAEIGEYPGPLFSYKLAVGIGDDPDDALDASFHNDGVAAVGTVSRDVAQTPQSLFQQRPCVIVQQLHYGIETVLGDDDLALTAGPISYVGDHPAGLELQLRTISVLHQGDEFGDCSVVQDPLQVGL